MNGPRKPDKGCLMLGMADRLGVDPWLLGPEALDRLVERCGRCTRADDCILWMVDTGPSAEAAPDYCLNGEELAALAAPRRR